MFEVGAENDGGVVDAVEGGGGGVGEHPSRHLPQDHAVPILPLAKGKLQLNKKFLICRKGVGGGGGYHAALNI